MRVHTSVQNLHAFALKYMSEEAGATVTRIESAIWRFARFMHKYANMPALDC
jgi:hypothetical protein